MKLDHKIAQAFAPASRATAVTHYNGVAIGSGPVGIPIGDASVANIMISLGSVHASVTGITYSVGVSSKTTTTSAADIVSIEEAIAKIVPADANSVEDGAIRVENIDAGAQVTGNPLYLYVKRQQADAYAVLDSVNVLLNEHKVQPTDQALEFDV
jgi:hypothetical protein